MTSLPPPALRAATSLAEGGKGRTDCRVASLLAMTVLILCHSEASAHTGRGNPSFLRWTGVRAAEVVGPYGRSTEVTATGRCGHRPLRKAQSTTQASRRAAKRPRLRPRGMGGNRRKDHPKRGTAPTIALAALSEAESAERETGQVRFCSPMNATPPNAGTQFFEVCLSAQPVGVFQVWSEVRDGQPPF